MLILFRRRVILIIPLGPIHKHLSNCAPSTHGAVDILDVLGTASTAPIRAGLVHSQRHHLFSLQADVASAA